MYRASSAAVLVLDSPLDRGGGLSAAARGVGGVGHASRRHKRISQPVHRALDHYAEPYKSPVAPSDAVSATRLHGPDITEEAATMANRETAHNLRQSDHADENLGSRIGWWARMAWPNSRAKNLANMLDVSEAQAKRILGGAAPTSSQLSVMARTWGWRFIAFAFEGIAGPSRPVFMMQAEMDERDQWGARLEQERQAEDARVGGALSAVESTRGSAIHGADDRRVVREDEATAHPVAPAPDEGERR